MKKLCVITGIAGDLGTSLNQVFSDKGFEIFGIDKTSPSVADKGKFYQADLNEDDIVNVIDIIVLINIVLGDRGYLHTISPIPNPILK